MNKSIDELILLITTSRYLSRKHYERFLEMFEDIKNDNVQTKYKDLIIDCYEKDREMVSLLVNMERYFAQNIEYYENDGKIGIKDLIGYRNVIDRKVGDELFEKYKDTEEIKEIVKGFKNPFYTMKAIFLVFLAFQNSGSPYSKGDKFELTKLFSEDE